jgi:hypothetical protein
MDVAGIGEKMPRNIMGVAIYHHMYRSNSGFLSFLAIRKEAQGQGTGILLFENVKKQVALDSLRNLAKPPSGIFCELARDTLSAKARRRLDFSSSRTTTADRMERRSR